MHFTHAMCILDKQCAFYTHNIQYAYNTTPGVPFTLKRKVMVPVPPRGISNFNGDVTFLADRAQLKVWVPLHDSFHPTSSLTQGGTRCILSFG
jgi:hypothetical protein